MAPEPTRPGSLSSRLSATTRVLVIEDDPDISEFLRAYFRASGYDFVHVDPASAAEGLAAIEEHRPDCVLLDMTLRGCSGLDVYRLARSEQSLSFTPVIIVTADDTARHRTGSTAIGIDGFVTKPFNVNTLATVVGQRIDAARKLEEAAVDGEAGVLSSAMLTARLADEMFHSRAAGSPLTFGLISMQVRDARRELGGEGETWLVRELVAEARPRLPREVVLARTSTDELALLAPSATPKETAKWLEHVLGELRGPRALPGGDQVTVELTAGLACYPDHAAEPDGLFMAADAALADGTDRGLLVAIAL